MLTKNLIIELAGASMTFLSVIYAVKERWISWIWAILSALFYAVIYWSAGLIVSAEIQLLYFGIAVVGLARWRKSPAVQQPKEIIKKGTPLLWMYTFLAISLLSLLLFWINSSIESGDLILYDALLVSSAIVAQALMVKKYLSCWYLWIFVNIGYLPLFFYQKLWVSLVLYVILFYFTWKGFKEWHRKYQFTT